MENYLLTLSLPYMYASNYIHALERKSCLPYNASRRLSKENRLQVVKQYFRGEKCSHLSSNVNITSPS